MCFCDMVLTNNFCTDIETTYMLQQPSGTYWCRIFGVTWCYNFLITLECKFLSRNCFFLLVMPKRFYFIVFLSIFHFQFYLRHRPGILHKANTKKDVPNWRGGKAPQVCYNNKLKTRN